MNAREQGRALATQFSEPSAFHMVDRLRKGEQLAPYEQQAVGGIAPDQQSEVDRYLEGRLSGISAVPLAAAFEASKPILRALPESVNRLLPEGFRYQEGVTSPPKLSNVTAAAQGALDSRRIVPYHVSAAIGRAVDQARALRGAF